MASLVEQRPFTAGSPPKGGRIYGLDVARALAIVGMVMVHFGPTNPPPDNLLALFYGLSSGRASILFVLLAGIGMTLLVGHRNREKCRRAWPILITRIVVLLPLGLALQLMDIRVLVILHYYAVFFVLAAPATLFRDGALLVTAAFFSIAGPVAYFLIGQARPEWLLRFDQVALYDPPGVIVRELLFTGSYPAMVWVAPFLFGMWLGRRRLNSLGTRAGLLIGGATVIGFAAWLGTPVPDEGWGQLASTEPHSQMILWLMGSTGSAVAALAICLLLTDLLGRLMWPLIAMGQLALTLYVGHLILLATWPGTFISPEVEPALVIVSGFALGAALFAVIWRGWFSRGPVEALLYIFPGSIQLWRSWRKKEEPPQKRAADDR